jgi:hypothetical protein
MSACFSTWVVDLPGFDDRLGSEAMQKNAMINKGLLTVIGVICVVIWVLLFAAGLMIPSEGYRKSLEHSATLRDFLMAGMLYTYTNVVTLTCFAGLLGGICSRITFRGSEAAEGDLHNHPATSLSIAYRTENPLASMFRSFVVFLVYIAGVAIGAPGGAEAFSTTAPDQYARVAGLLSLMGFAVGFDPTLFGTLLTKVPGSLKKADDQKPHVPAA